MIEEGSESRLYGEGVEDGKARSALGPSIDRTFKADPASKSWAGSTGQ